MKVTYSDYLLSRRFNRKVYDKVKQAIERLTFIATAEFSMNAKYQAPVIHVTGPEHGEAADEIYNLLDEYFRVSEPEFIDENETNIMFSDEE